MKCPALASGVPLPEVPQWTRTECLSFHRLGLQKAFLLCCLKAKYRPPFAGNISKISMLRKDLLQWAVESNDFLTWQARKNILSTRYLGDFAM